MTHFDDAVVQSRVFKITGFPHLARAVSQMKKKTMSLASTSDKALVLAFKVHDSN